MANGPRGPAAGRGREGVIGRRRELDALGAWLDGTRRGAGRLVLCVGEPGIGKTRLAQELAGIALAGGTTVAWGRCVEAEGSPAFWPWRQVLRSLRTDPETVLSGDVESPEDRFRVFEGITEVVRKAAGNSTLTLILDDIHWADEPSLLALRHLADHVDSAPLLVFAAFRDVEPASLLPRVLPALLRSPAVERIDLHGFGLAEVREQLTRTGAGEPDAHASTVLDVTGGNPLFVREMARAMADGSWRADRPPRTVLDLVSARLDDVSGGCRELVQAAAIVGRDFSLALVAAAVELPVGRCLPLVDEAAAYGLVDQVGDAGEYRFVHALTREAVEASLTTIRRVELHRAVAMTLETAPAGDPSVRLGQIAGHWAQLAPYGESATARAWAIRAAEDAVRRLAFEEGVRLYHRATAMESNSETPTERCAVRIALGRAAYFAGNVQACADAAIAAAETAEQAQSPELMGEAALVLEATAYPAVNAVAERLCELALTALGGRGNEALRARLLALRSHLAYYDGDQGRVESESAAALDLARASGDDRAVAEALHARKEACPGPAGREERLALASEMAAVAARSDGARAAMWAALWRIEGLIEHGDLAAAAEGLAGLRSAVERVGGPVSAWHLERVTACIALAQGRYEEAVGAGRRAFERMHPVEPGPARGGYFALQTALAGHIGITEAAAPFVAQAFEPLPRFRTMAPLSRGFLLLCAGRPEEADASYRLAGPMSTWAPPAFYAVPCYALAAAVAAEVGRHDDLAVLLDRLEPFRGEHVAGDGVIYLGPVELALGRGAAALGRLDQAVDDLSVASERADRAGARGFAAEARYHLAVSLLRRNGPGDQQRALVAASEADRSARALGMAAYVDRTGALVAHLGPTAPPALSRRELEVATLVAGGLTNRQIAERLVISDRTAQNHVQHILTKLGFTTRSQIAAWAAGVKD